MIVFNNIYFLKWLYVNFLIYKEFVKNGFKSKVVLFVRYG